jgi:hypothetical protein
MSDEVTGTEWERCGYVFVYAKLQQVMKMQLANFTFSHFSQKEK